MRTSAAQRSFWPDAVLAAAIAAVLSGIPSTVHAWWTGRDLLESTRAAGAMLIEPQSSDLALFLAAAIVHPAISLFWATVLARVLPRTWTLAWALVAAAGIAILDLRLIGRLFPEVFALPFWPQFADHLAWGGVVGLVLTWRSRKRS